MNDGSRSFNGLREEWSLLVHSIIDDTEESKPKSEKLILNDLSLEQIMSVRSDLSQQKQVLHLKIEKIKNQIDNLGSVIENLELVGSDPDPIVLEIQTLNDQGQAISSQIAILDSKIKKIHELKDKLVLISNPA